MISAAKLQENAEDSARLRATITAAHQRLQSAIAEVEKDGLLNDSQREFAIKKAREKEVPKIIEVLNKIQDIAKATRGQQRYWESADFVLAQTMFSEAPSIHATVSMAKRQELVGMSGPLLALTFQDAKDTQNFALMNLVLSVRAQRLQAGEDSDHLGGNEAFSLNGVEIPGQRQALAALTAIDTDRKLAETAFSAANGTRIDPAGKLVNARTQQQAERMSKEAAGAGT